MKQWETVKITLTSADLPRAMKQLSAQGVTFSDVQTENELTLSCSVTRRDHAALCRYAQKHGDQVTVRSRTGLRQKLLAVGKRPVLLAVTAALLLLTVYLPKKVLFIQVQGNEAIPSRQILEAAADCGIRFGASRREVRSEQVKNRLLSRIPQLQWAGVNTGGCVARITVRERAPEEQEMAAPGWGSLVAVRDGVVTSCTVRKGTALCTVGQAVKAGDTLISGYPNCGNLPELTQAEGEVYACTRRHLTMIFPAEHWVRADTGTEKTKYSLLVGKKRIKFGKDSRICEATCGKIYKEYYLTLPGAFRLPLGLLRETVVSGEITPSEEREEASRSKAARDYLTAHMAAGVILDARETVDGQLLHGEYACTELISAPQAERNGESYGETS